MSRSTVRVLAVIAIIVLVVIGCATAGDHGPRPSIRHPSVRLGPAVKYTRGPDGVVHQVRPGAGGGRHRNAERPLSARADDGGASSR